MQRRLAAIVAIDVVGYSRLMERDEVGTLEQVRRVCTEVLGPIVNKHGGHIFKFTGDGALAEFASAVDAVEAAWQVQMSMASRDVTSAPLLTLRIGINLGDVIAEDNDVYGDGVNIAARLEGIAEPGTIYVSGTIYDTSNKVVPYAFIPIGRRSLKNIAKPVRVYRLESSRSSIKIPRPLRSHPALALWGLSILIAFVFIGAATYLYYADSVRTFEPVAIDELDLPLPERPSIAVLPFKTSSDTPRSTAVAVGLAAQLRDDLGSRPEVFVISERSSLELAATDADTRTVSQDLGVRYILTGSYSESEGNADVRIRLSDMLEGRVVLTDSIRIPLQQVTGLPGTLASAVLSEVLRLPNRERLQFPPPTKHFDAWLIHLQASKVYETVSRDNSLTARELWRKARALDPTFLTPEVMIGWSHWADSRFGWAVDPDQSLDLAAQSADGVLESDTENGDAYDLLGSVESQRGRQVEALNLASRATRLKPNDADAFARLAIAQVFARQPDRALETIRTATRLNPHFPPWYLMPVAEAHRVRGEFDAAIQAALDEARSSENPYVLLRLAIYHALAGNSDRAREVISKARLESPRLTIADWDRFSRPHDRERAAADRTLLLSHGLPAVVSFDCLTRGDCR